MKKLWIFVLGAAAISTLLTGAVVATVFWAIISVIVNGGHPWHYDKFWLLGGIPAGFFILFEKWCHSMEQYINQAFMI